KDSHQTIMNHDVRFFFSSRRRHTRFSRDWSSDVCSSDLGTLPVARLSIDRSGIGMNLAENLSRDFPQVVGENFTNESKERWATEIGRASCRERELKPVGSVM